MPPLTDRPRHYYKGESVRIIVVLMLMAWCSLVHAAIYNVGPGKGNYPTIAAAVAKARAGDTVLVKPGTYNELVTTQTAGSSANKIVLKSLMRRTAIVSGIRIDHAYVRVEGFTVAGAGISINAGQAEVVDNYIENCADAAISTKAGVRDIVISHNRIYHSQYGIIVSGRNILVDHNEVERVFRYNKGDCDYARFFGDSIVFRYNHFHGTRFDTTGHYEVPGAHLDCWQTFDNNGEHAKDITWENNTCADCDEGVMAEGIFNKKSSGFLFRNNLFYEISENAVSLDSNAAARIDYNFYCRARAHFKTGQHDIENRDPLFFNPDSGDFRLQKGSPAIGAGKDLGVAFDLNGAPRKNPPDIGAYEAESVLPAK
jgi:hypothetical protein